MDGQQHPWPWPTGPAALVFELLHQNCLHISPSVPMGAKIQSWLTALKNQCRMKKWSTTFHSGSHILVKATGGTYWSFKNVQEGFGNNTHTHRTIMNKVSKMYMEFCALLRLETLLLLTFQAHLGLPPNRMKCQVTWMIRLTQHDTWDAPLFQKSSINYTWSKNTPHGTHRGAVCSRKCSWISLYLGITRGAFQTRDSRPHLYILILHIWVGSLHL